MRSRWAGDDVHPLRAERLRHRLTLHQLGDLSGCSWQHVAAIELGHRGASPDVWSRLARALCVEVQQIRPDAAPNPRQLEIAEAGR